jgi:hypothetical protein
VKVILRLRSILFCGALFVGAAGALAAGEYQQARDSKTMIWNSTPKEGETASWSGDRDKEDYASGFGDLTWYNATGKVYALYYGNMVHGKFEGPVNVHSTGRTAHAYFVDGGRVTAWARGPAPAKMDVPEAIAEKRKQAEAEKNAASKREAAKERTSESPAPRPIVKKATRVEKVAATTPKPKPSAPETTPEIAPDKPEVATSEKKPTPEPRETPPTVAEKNSEDATISSPIRAFHEPKALPKSEPDRLSSQQTTEVRSQISEVSEPKPTAEKIAKRDEENMERPTPNIAALKTTPIESADAEHPTAESSAVSHPSSLIPQPSATESPADVSASALVGPPSSLRTTSIPDMSPEKSGTLLSTSENAPLTETEAIGLADTEARIQGYEPNDYERPKVDYSRVKGKWSLFYGLKKTEGESDKPATLTVTVEDKTKKVEIRK